MKKQISKIERIKKTILLFATLSSGNPLIVDGRIPMPQRKALKSIIIQAKKINEREL